jgi:hypothetical protein
MSRQSKYYQRHLNRGKITHGHESLSDEGSAGRKGRAYVMRVDNRARLTSAAATPAVRADASTVNYGAVRKVSGARQHPAAIADNATALGQQFSRLAGSRDASGSEGRNRRVYVTRVDDRARVTYAAATPAVRAHASTVIK